MTRVLQFLVDLVTPAFYGNVTIRFEAGQAVKVRVEHDYRCDKLPPSRGAQVVRVEAR